MLAAGNKQHTGSKLIQPQPGGTERPNWKTCHVWCGGGTRYTPLGPLSPLGFISHNHTQYSMGVLCMQDQMQATVTIVVLVVFMCC